MYVFFLHDITDNTQFFPGFRCQLFSTARFVRKTNKIKTVGKADAKHRQGQYTRIIPLLPES